MTKVGVLRGIFRVIRLMGPKIEPSAVQVPLNKCIELLFVDLYQGTDGLGKYVQKVASFLAIDSTRIDGVFRWRHGGTGTQSGFHLANAEPPPSDPRPRACSRSLAAGTTDPFATQSRWT